MQQLLTGKKRLKGFEGGNFHRLGNYISECNRRNNGCNRVLSVTNTRGFILQEEQFDKIVASNDTSNYKVVRRDEFAYNPSRVNVGSLAMLKEYDEGILSPMYIVFKANENINKTYLLQCLQSWWFRGHIPAYTQGSVRDSLSFDGLCSMKFYIPTLQEQKAISAILEQADKEIEIQKQKLEVLQEQKKGLMQVLLTGKRRIL
jgi:type I restriction enzyme S subunit